MGAAEEVECRALPALPEPPRPEVQVPRLVRVETQSVPLEPLAQHGQHALAVPVALEEQHGVVGVTHQQAAPSHARSHLPLEPRVQHVMQEQVRQQGADHAPNAKGNFEFERVCEFSNRG